MAETLLLSPLAPSDPAYGNGTAQRHRRLVARSRACGLGEAPVCEGTGINDEGDRRNYLIYTRPVEASTRASPSGPSSLISVQYSDAQGPGTVHN